MVVAIPGPLFLASDSFTDKWGQTRNFVAKLEDAVWERVCETPGITTTTGTITSSLTVVGVLGAIGGGLLPGLD